MDDGTPNELPPVWPRHESEPGPELMICRARFDALTNPRTGQRLRRLVLEMPDWVNVVALTPERRLIVVRQFRFGTSTVTTEIPGGVIDPGEDSEAAARRELSEETGYTSERWSYLGAVQPNPAFQTNLCHHWLAEEAVLTRPQDQDEGEDIRVATLSLDEVADQIRSGQIQHALVLTALMRILDLRGAGSPAAGS